MHSDDRGSQERHDALLAHQLSLELDEAEILESVLRSTAAGDAHDTASRTYTSPINGDILDSLSRNHGGGDLSAEDSEEPSETHLNSISQPAEVNGWHELVAHQLALEEDEDDIVNAIAHSTVETASYDTSPVDIHSAGQNGSPSSARSEDADERHRLALGDHQRPEGSALRRLWRRSTNPTGPSSVARNARLPSYEEALSEPTQNMRQPSKANFFSKHKDSAAQTRNARPESTAAHSQSERRRTSFKDVIARVKDLTGEDFPTQRRALFTLPLQNRGDGAPFLAWLPIDILNCIIEQLYFPDAFALALTCKDAHALINLSLKKQAYRSALRQHAKFLNGDFCDACLFKLPFRYFNVKLPLSTRHRAASMVCRQCEAFRAQVQQYEDRNRTSDLLRSPKRQGKSLELPSFPVRQGKVREVLSTNGMLWYREV